MANKNSFTPEEWDSIRQAPFMAGIAIVVASPSGLVGLWKESAAAGQMVFDRAANASSELVKSVAGDIRENMQVPKPNSTDPAQVKTQALSSLTRALRALETKASAAEAAEYKNWLYSIAKGVAEAAKEGGFLGFGGTQVSEAETAALREVANTLGISGAAASA